MAFTTSDLDAINAAIASGELTVRHNGREVTYRSIVGPAKGQADDRGGPRDAGPGGRAGRQLPLHVPDRAGASNGRRRPSLRRRRVRPPGRRLQSGSRSVAAPRPAAAGPRLRRRQQEGRLESAALGRVGEHRPPGGRCVTARDRARWCRTSRTSPKACAALVANAVGHRHHPALDRRKRTSTTSSGRSGGRCATRTAASTSTAMQAAAYRAMQQDGEVLIRLRPRRESDGLPVPLQLQLLEIDWLDSTAARWPTGTTVINGIEYDHLGRSLGTGSSISTPAS
jgi:hypothetical protein